MNKLNILNSFVLWPKSTKLLRKGSSGMPDIFFSDASCQLNGKGKFGLPQNSVYRSNLGFAIWSKARARLAWGLQLKLSPVTKVHELDDWQYLLPVETFPCDFVSKNISIWIKWYLYWNSMFRERIHLLWICLWSFLSIILFLLQEESHSKELFKIDQESLSHQQVFSSFLSCSQRVNENDRV